MRQRRGGKKMERRVEASLAFRAEVDRLVEGELAEFMRGEAMWHLDESSLPGHLFYADRVN